MSKRILVMMLFAALCVCVAPAQAAKKASKAEQQDISATYAKAVELVNNHQWSAGMAAMTKVIENPQTPKDILANAYSDRGMCYANTKKTDEAIMDFNKALEMKPDLLGTYYERGRALAMKGKHAEAVQDFTKAISGSQPSIITAGYYYNRGISSMNMSPPNPEQAKSDFAMAKKLNPKLKIPKKYKDL
ncbi:MAG: tetratricopeptide repeat protein [Desulfovibrio sp.]|nr:tetratricopeptide repeat protein [Desulfovibrio sp.]MBI4959998.1 tetratricopeptide repeat protein [Desulfovibrio sp.]